jgi:CTP synthase
MQKKNCTTWMPYWLLPGFGSRGIEGKIDAIRYARVNNIPFFGICLGMQMACVEFARNVLNMPKAHSTEMNPDTHEGVICMMEEQKADYTEGRHHATGQL